ncbi:MAG: T9SS type A sorting domain-containing protein [Atribacterota bacterium]|jgi:hypothetical protein|nr:T9SS type A sorting domain-containing protein [Atribacterota bacterium]
MKHIFLLLLFVLANILVYGQYKEIIYDEENELHHIQIVQLDNKILLPSKVISVKTPIVFTSFAVGWKIEQEISPSDIIIKYRVHKPQKGWTEWKEDEAYITPNETRWQMYQTDLLFGLDEGVHDSLEFYYEIPDGVVCMGVYLILQDLSPQLDEPIIRNDSDGILLSDRSCPALPTMIPRSSWCGSYSACQHPTYTPTYISATHTVIHHGASPNSYSDGAVVVRSYWNYHVNTNGWSDIGYNYLFDKYGNMYVGRYNPNLPNSDVKGAHAGSANSKSIGLNYLGNSDASGTAPTTAQNNKCCQFMAWWYDHKGFDPTSSASILCQDNVTRTIKRICGHRDVNPGGTTCPGNALYALLPTLRTNTKQIIEACEAPPPQIFISSNPSTICSGQSTILTASGASTYTWSHSLGSGDTKTVSPMTTTTYTVTGTGSYGATNTATITITVNPKPNISIYATKDTLCKGDTAIIFATGGDSYSWSHNLGLQPIVTIMPEISATYFATATNSFNCSNIDSISIIVNQLPNISINAQPSTICQGDTAIITATGAHHYYWSSNANNDIISVSPNSSTSYIVTGYSYEGCSSSVSIAIIVKPTPPKPIIIITNNSPFILMSTSNMGNQWYLNDNPIYGATDQTYTVNENGNYFTIVTIDGCSSLPSNQITINNVGINDYADNEILVYPNPAHDIIYVQSSKPINEVMIINNLGQVVANYSKNSIININQLANGVYQIMIKTENNIKVLPLIKIH